MSFFHMKNRKRNAAANQSRESRPIQEERKALLTSGSDFFIREAYKTLRTNVSFSLAGDEGCKVIVVTSSTQGEGKSITAVNLAISYAMTDCKVLVVDCDLRRPKLARLMQMNGRVGLSNLIVQPALLEKAVIHSETSGLDVILSGDIPPNPSELLGSLRMKRLLKNLRESYDYIILDSPPVNVVTDAVVLAPESDGVLFLVRAGHTERGAVLHAVEQLKYVKAKLLGFVLNDVDVEKSHHGYKKYRGGRYSYYGGLYGYDKGYTYSSSTSRHLNEMPQEEQGTEQA